MRSWCGKATVSRVAPLVLVLLTALAVVTMHALDHEAAHTPIAVSDVYEEHSGGDAGHGTGDAGGNNSVALLAASACAFIMLVAALGVLRRRDVLRRRYVGGDSAASQVLVGPEPPVPRVLLVMS